MRVDRRRDCARDGTPLPVARWSGVPRSSRQLDRSATLVRHIRNARPRVPPRAVVPALAVHGRRRVPAVGTVDPGADGRAAHHRRPAEHDGRQRDLLRALLGRRRDRRSAVAHCGAGRHRQSRPYVVGRRSAAVPDRRLAPVAGGRHRGVPVQSPVGRERASGSRGTVDDSSPRGARRRSAPRRRLVLPCRRARRVGWRRRVLDLAGIRRVVDVVAWPRVDGARSHGRVRAVGRRPIRSGRSPCGRLVGRAVQCRSAAAVRRRRPRWCREPPRLVRGGDHRERDDPAHRVRAGTPREVPAIRRRDRCHSARSVVSAQAGCCSTAAGAIVARRRLTTSRRGCCDSRKRM